MGGGDQYALYGHPYLKNLIQLWPGDLFKQMKNY